MRHYKQQDAHRNEKCEVSNKYRDRYVGPFGLEFERLSQSSIHAVLQNPLLFRHSYPFALPFSISLSLFRFRDCLGALTLAMFSPSSKLSFFGCTFSYPGPSSKPYAMRNGKPPSQSDPEPPNNCLSNLTGPHPPS
jgi:hypothetical protein